MYRAWADVRQWVGRLHAWLQTWKCNVFAVRARAAGAGRWQDVDVPVKELSLGSFYLTISMLWPVRLYRSPNERMSSVQYQVSTVL